MTATKSKTRGNPTWAKKMLASQGTKSYDTTCKGRKEIFKEVVKDFNDLVLTGQKETIYATDIPVEEPRDEGDIGLCERLDITHSPFPAIPGDLINQLYPVIPGLHTTFLYAGLTFSVFSLHTEDQYLCSLNYSHIGWKYWIVASPDDFTELERHLFERWQVDHPKEVPTSCSQVSPTFRSFRWEC